MSLKIIVTSDGSHSVLNEALDETYHSRHGARQESVHVFIKNGLEFFSKTNRAVSILEVGFGTGLNALLSLEYANRHNISVFYTTIESSPLQEEIWSKLNYTDSVEMKEVFSELHRLPWNEEAAVNSSFRLIKLSQTLQDVALGVLAYDIIYYDAFAPSKQPAMWELPVLDKVAQSLRRSGIFVTYCAKGELKRNLRKLGLQVEVLPGPPGKREMIRVAKV